MTFQKYFPQVQYLKKNNQVYLDNAATTLKPQCVIDLLKDFYETKVCNVHRGDHYLSNELTLKYEQVRARIQTWIGAGHSDEIIFTKSTTEGINFLSVSLSHLLQEGDEILLTEMEHHSNLIPWQELAKKKNLRLKFLPVDPHGELILDEWDNIVSKRTKIISFTYYSNVLGTRNPVEKLSAWAKERNILSIIDAAQAMTAEPIDVQKIKCDFLVFSGHKLFAPTGVGVLYVKREHMEKLQPYQFGGGIVSDVSLYDRELVEPPQCFEAGTPPIEGVLALGAVIDFLKQQPFFDTLKQKTTALTKQTEMELKKIKGVQIIGTSPTRVSILSFVLNGMHSQDVGQLVSQAGVAIRAGHHCCLPLMKKYELLSGTIRASFSPYNDEKDIEFFIDTVKKAKRMLS